MKLIYKIAISITVCLLVGFLSGLSTSFAIENWYVFLEKPALNPPNWVFGPVWSILYVAMGIAAALVWHQDWNRVEVQSALLTFLAQLLLNASWSVVFFGMQSPGGALAIILILWVLILVCIRKFYPLNKPAALLMIPYLLWVSFAVYLNGAIWYLN